MALTLGQNQNPNQKQNQLSGKVTIQHYSFMFMPGHGRSQRALCLSYEFLVLSHKQSTVNTSSAKQGWRRSCPSSWLTIQMGFAGRSLICICLSRACQPHIIPSAWCVCVAQFFDSTRLRDSFCAFRLQQRKWKLQRDKASRQQQQQSRQRQMAGRNFWDTRGTWGLGGRKGPKGICHFRLGARDFCGINRKN